MQSVEEKVSEIPSDVLNLILGFYEDDIRYLKSASIESPPADNPRERIKYAGSGKFSIPYCYYLKNKHGSSHFNAADFILCFNQMSYTFVADLVRRGMVPELGVDASGFEKGMDGALIAKWDEIVFRKPINPRDFYGSIFMERIRKGPRSAMCHINMVFEDGNGGYSEGGALMAFLLVQHPKS